MWNNIFFNTYKSSYGSNYLHSRTENYTNPNTHIAKSKNNPKDSFAKTILTVGGITIAGIALFKGRAGISKLLKSGSDILLKHIPKK